MVLGNNVVGEWRNDEYNAVYFDDIEGAYDATVIYSPWATVRFGMRGQSSAALV